MDEATTWLGAFEAKDASPWPGPKPIVTSGDRWLHGRDTAAAAFLAAVLDHTLVVLTADSGVGKSSLLEGKLLPDLDKDGFQAVLIKQWSLDEGADPSVYVAEYVAAALGRQDAGDDRFWETVDRSLGDRLVIVLDQFEELVRFQPAVFQRTIDWIKELNKDHRIRVVLSLRAEFVHQLRELERSARPFTYTTYRLEPIAADKDILKIVLGTEGSGGIEPDAADAVVELWTEVSKKALPGLLRLQGLLYALHHRANPRPTSLVRKVTKEDVRRLTADAATTEEDETTVFDFGLAEAARFKVEHCRGASLDAGFDRLLVDGTEGVLLRALPLLSSGGFKLVLDEWTVASQALDREFKRTAVDEDGRKALFALVRGISPEEVDAFFASTWNPDDPLVDPQMMVPLVDRPDAPEAPVGEGETVRYEHDEWVSWNHGSYRGAEVSSGALLDMPPAAVLYQVLRRFAFAMTWLEASSLVRRTSPVDGVTMVALIHDGFGLVLEQGIDRSDRIVDHLLAEVVAPSGEQLPWDAASFQGYRDRILGKGSGNPLPLTNLRWRDCALVGVTLTDVVFVNGDFRGTRFDGCTFKGVTFVNCLLDNAAFIDCRIVGGTGIALPKEKHEVEALAVAGDRDLPDFRVPVPMAEAELLVRYRGTEPLAATPDEPSGPVDLYSRTSGISAHPATKRCRAGIDLTPATGGLVMFGGRLSSLMVRNGSFEPGRDGEPGTLALRHIAGASLDLVEHVGGRLEVVDSTIRGITVSSPITASRPVTGTRIEVITAVLGNVWFGDGLNGGATLRDCNVLQLTNLNEKDSFEVRADLIDEDTVAVGLIGGLKKLRKLFAAAAPSKPQPPLEDLRKMDYRRRPAEIELDHRRRP